MGKDEKIYFSVQNWLLRDLTANPDNYRSHPPEQIAHIKHSLATLGQYKNVVARPDGTILAGHGVVAAARELGWETIAVHVFDGDEAQQRLLLVADNEISRIVVDDDEKLASLLADIKRQGELLGTGFDDAGLQNILADLQRAELPESFPEYDENIDLDDIEMAICPECGHEFPV